MEKKGLSTNSIKLIAICTMIVDHIAWNFNFSGDISFIMHFIGRTTAPIMCFFIVEGYLHTCNLKNYMKRLILFSIISQIPFSYFQVEKIGIVPMNMIFTLFLGLLGDYIYDKVSSKPMKMTLLIIIFYLSFLCDWLIIGYILPLIFFILKENPIKQYISIIVISVLSIFLYQGIYQVGMILAIPLLMLYNGKVGNFIFGKCFFYIIYPLQFLFIELILYLVS